MGQLSPLMQIIIAIAPAAATAFFVWLSARKSAARDRDRERERAADKEFIARQSLVLENRKLSDEADERARVMYGKLIDDMRDEIERLHRAINRVQEQHDRVADQLLREQDLSTTLRNELVKWRSLVQQLQYRIEALENLIKKIGGEIPTELGTLPTLPSTKSRKDTQDA